MKIHFKLLEGKRNFLLGTLTLGLFLFAFRDFINVGMLAYGDEPPFPETAGQAFEAFFSSWHPISEGITIPYPINFFLAGITILLCGGNAVVAQKIWYFFPMPLSFVTMYFFLRRFTKSTSAKWIASFVYSVNPVTIGPPYVGGAVGMLLVYALLPLFIDRAIALFTITGKTLRNILILTLLFTLTGMSAMLYIFPFLLFLFLYTLARKKIKFALTRIALIISLFFFFLGLTLPYSYYSAPILRYLPTPLATQPPPIPISELVEGIKYTYSDQTMLNLLNFGAKALPFPGYSSYTSWWALLGFLYPALAFSSLLFSRKSRKIKVILGFSIFSLTILTLIWLTKLGPGLQLFRFFPVLFTFSNPSGLLMMLMFGYSPLIAFSLDQISEKSSRFFIAIETELAEIKSRVENARFNPRKLVRRNVILAVSLTLLLSAYVWPFFTGNMGFSSIGVSATQLAIPSRFYEISSWLNAHEEDNIPFRTLWVPIDYTTQLYIRWLDPRALTLPLGIGQYVELPVAKYIGFVFQALADNETNRIGALLAPLNVKYIIVDLKSTQTGLPKATGFLNYGEPFLFGSPSNYVKILNNQRDLKLVYNQTDFLVYKNLDFQQRIAVFQDAFYITSIGVMNRSLSDLDAVKVFSSSPICNPSGHALILESDLPADQQKWLKDIATAVIMNIGNVTEASINDKNISSLQQVICQIVKTKPSSATWTPISGEWTIENNTLVGTAPLMPGNWSLATILYKQLTLSDFEVQLKFNIQSPVEGAAYQQPGIFLRWGTSGFYWVKIEANYGKIAVYSQNEAIATAPINIQPNTWYELKVTLENTRLLVYINMTKYIDTPLPSGVASGYVGLTSEGYHAARIAFKDVRISSLDGKTLYYSGLPWPYTLAEAKIPIFKAGNYSIFVYAPGDEPVILNFGDKVAKAIQLAENWYVTPSVYLNHGIYNVTINYGNRVLSESDTQQNHIVVTSSNFMVNQTLQFDQPLVNWSFQRVSPTKYELILKSNRPVYIQLSEMYSPAWKAYANGTELPHYIASLYLNGFYLNKSGTYQIVIEYEGQSIKNLTIVVWITSWLFLFCGLLYVFRGKLSISLRLFKRCWHSC